LFMLSLVVVGSQRYVGQLWATNSSTIRPKRAFGWTCRSEAAYAPAMGHDVTGDCPAPGQARNSLRQPRRVRSAEGAAARRQWACKTVGTRRAIKLKLLLKAASGLKSAGSFGFEGSLSLQSRFAHVNSPGAQISGLLLGNLTRAAARSNAARNLRIRSLRTS